MPELKSSSKSKARIWNNLGERVRRDFEFQAAAGTMPGVAVHHVFGYDDVIELARHPVWPGVGAYDYFTDSQALSIVSGSVNDTYKGSGGWILRIIGLDCNYEVQMEDVLLRGTTPVISQGEYIRVYHAVILQSGTLDGLDDILTITGARDGKIIGNLSGAWNLMTNAVFTVPAHTNAYLYEFEFTMNATKPLILGVRRTTPVEENKTWITEYVGLLESGTYREKLTPPAVYPEFTDIELTVEASGGGAAAIVAYATLILIDETFEWEQFTTQDEICSISRPDSKE